METISNGDNKNEKPTENEEEKPALAQPPIENEKKKPIKKKVKKKKKVREEGAPKMPLTGYVRFMNERREKLRIECPDKTAIEHTKIIGEEWNNMPEEAKAPFLNAYLVERVKYKEELSKFLKEKSLAEQEKEKEKACDPNSATVTSAKNSITNSNSNKKSSIKNLTNNTNGGITHSSNNETIVTNDNDKPASSISLKPYADGSGIQIFTDEFLEHNKVAEIELKALRKSTTDYELQNSALEKHVENMKFGVEKIENESKELEEKNKLLQSYLDKLKLKLATALTGLSIPSEPQGASIENIDKYINDLVGMTACNSHGPASLNKAKDIIRKLDVNT